MNFHIKIPILRRSGRVTPITDTLIPSFTGNISPFEFHYNQQCVLPLSIPSLSSPSSSPLSSPSLLRSSLSYHPVPKEFFEYQNYVCVSNTWTPDKIVRSDDYSIVSMSELTQLVVDFSVEDVDDDGWLYSSNEIILNNNSSVRCRKWIFPYSVSSDILPVK